MQDCSISSALTMEILQLSPSRRYKVSTRCLESVICATVVVNAATGLYIQQLFMLTTMNTLDLRITWILWGDSSHRAPLMQKVMPCQVVTMTLGWWVDCTTWHYACWRYTSQKLSIVIHYSFRGRSSDAGNEGNQPYVLIHYTINTHD